LPRFIEEVYNEKRVHSGIDYMTPNELEERVRKDPSNPDNRRFDLPL
jgi:transposase InsO family protein